MPIKINAQSLWFSLAGDGSLVHVGFLLNDGSLANDLLIFKPQILD
jgi:hypothetical protein